MPEKKTRSKAAKKNVGICYLVGAGPGDPGLMTLRGRECIELADVVVYDYLSNVDFLKWARPDAEKIYVGKKSKDHTLPQGGINQLLIDKAREGKIVTRLKGGDPLVFGRGGEEAEVLIDAGIDVEVVPGITSAIAAPAAAASNTESAVGASESARTTFLNSPATKKAMPTATVSHRSRNLRSSRYWPMTSSWWTIGPAINCGKKSTNRAYSMNVPV